MTYVDSVLKSAATQGLSSAQIAALGYRDIAALAGVTIEKNGDSPKDFIFENVRARVRRELDNAESLAATTELRITLEAAMKDSGNVVTVNDKTGEVIVTTAKAAIAAEDSRE